MQTKYNSKIPKSSWNASGAVSSSPEVIAANTLKMSGAPFPRASSVTPLLKVKEPRL